jgi:hypothetical protein
VKVNYDLTQPVALTNFKIQSVFTVTTAFYRSVQLKGHTNDINFIVRTDRAISEVYEQLRETETERERSRAQHECPKNKTKTMVQNRKTTRRSEMLTINP